jgi:hypothetical protein
MGFHFAKVVAELSQGISVGGRSEAGESGSVDIGAASAKAPI